MTDTFSFAAQYLLEWDDFRYPEGGTYLGPVDFAFNGPIASSFPRASASRTAARPEPENSGEWGLASRWSPEWLDGTLGFYYRNYADKLPQTFITRVAPVLGSQYNLIYTDDVDLFGISLAKNVGRVSLGAEVSYRHNTPLNSTVLGIAPGLPAEGETKGPRGDTLARARQRARRVSATPVFDTAGWAAELAWAKYTDVNSGENLFYALGYAPATTATCGTAARPDYFGIGPSFTPTWFQVFPGVDLAAPITYGARP